MLSVRRISVIAVALFMCIAASARAQVLQQVPSGAMVVIKLKDLGDVSGKIAALSQAWGLANIRPELNDPLGTLLTAANLGPGLNKAGEAAVAIMPVTPGAEPNMVFLIPVSDFKAFSGSLPNSKMEGDTMTFTMGNNPKPGYVGNWGKYAAISPQKEMVAKAGTGVEAMGLTAKELASKDLIVYANFKEVSKLALPPLQQNRDQILKAMEQGAANAPNANPKFTPVLKAYMGQILTVAESFLKDTESMTFGINLSKEGISTTLVAQFDPGSYAGKAMAGFKNTDASFTIGLPEGKYFVYGGGLVGEAGIKMLNDFLAPIEKELAALGANEGKAIADYLAAMRAYLAATKQFNFGMVAPPAAAFGQEGLIQVVSVVSGDSAKMMASQKQMMATQNDLMKVMGAEAMGGKTTSTPNAKTVEGVSLDQFTSTFNMQPQTPQEQQMAFLMTMLYGPKGMTGYMGAVGADKMVGVVGGNDALLTSAVKSAKDGSDAVGKGVAAKVTAGLPASRHAAFYLPIDTIATTILDVMAAQGMPGGVKLPPNLPPLGASFGTEGSAMRMDGYIPAQTVQSMIAAGMQIWLQRMQGGGQPGGL